MKPESDSTGKLIKPVGNKIDAAVSLYEGKDLMI